MVHLYEDLTNKLGTTYFLPQNQFFSIELNMNEVDDENKKQVIERVKQIAFNYSGDGPARGLRNLLDESPTFFLTQITNDFGWFLVTPSN